MFEELFRHSPSLERHRTAPLVEERVEYLRYLDTVGIQRRTLAKLAAYLLRLIRLLELTGAPGGEYRRGRGGGEGVVTAWDGWIPQAVGAPYSNEVRRQLAPLAAVPVLA